MERLHVMIGKFMIFFKDLIILDQESFHQSISSMKLWWNSRKESIKKGLKRKNIKS